MVKTFEEFDKLPGRDFRFKPWLPINHQGLDLMTRLGSFVEITGYQFIWEPREKVGGGEVELVLGSVMGGA